MTTTIALDYDGTYTTMPEIWLDFIQKVLDKGHKVVVVTMRREEEGDNIDPRLKALVPIMYTSRKAKIKYARMNGLTPNIWIEDQPHWLHEDAIY
jgi:stalled ribosome rescue protein Dom34